MPSIAEFIDAARPVIDEQVKRAALDERRHVVNEVGRALDRARSLDDVREWYALNVQLLEAVDQL